MCGDRTPDSHPDGRILPGGMSNLHGAPYGHLKALRCCFSTSSAPRTRFCFHLQLKNSIHHSSKRVPANRTHPLGCDMAVWDGTVLISFEEQVPLDHNPFLIELRSNPLGASFA